MRCPPLTELPPPPPGKTGWPWTEESPQLPDTTPDNRPWPQVSIVTPSYNQGRFLEETIRSVLLQGYPNLEYIIIDGGSTDGSVEIIRRYEPWLAYWVSEPDRGQAHAINKGWKRARGDVLAYLNSDDYYLRGAVASAVQELWSRAAAAMVYGDALLVDEQGHHLGLRRSRPFDLADLLCHWCHISQPTVFIAYGALEKVGLLDESLHMPMDYDLWLRIGLSLETAYVPNLCWAAMRAHADAKSTALFHTCWPELERVLERIFADPRLPSRIRKLRSRALARIYFGYVESSLYHDNLREAVRWFARCLFMAPGYVVRHPLVSMYFVKEFALRGIGVK